MIAIRKSEDRGHANHGWLDSHFSFSFSEYYDPDHIQFRALRVINEDHVAPSSGFPMHGHRDMEIVTYLMSGALEHKDSMGNGAVLHPGEVQRISAGTGIRHSEFNPSDKDEVHLLQIWLTPKATGITPSYEQKDFPAAEKQNRLRLVASPDAADGSITIHQDTRLYAALLDTNKELRHALAPKRHAWLQIARGDLTLNGQRLSAGDGAAVSDEKELLIKAQSPAEFLLFDLS